MEHWRSTMLRGKLRLRTLLTDSFSGILRIVGTYMQMY